MSTNQHIYNLPNYKSKDSKTSFPTKETEKEENKNLFKLKMNDENKKQVNGRNEQLK